ncbi:MAG: SIR2 family protein [Cyanobacteria bacterium P01_G01_bin.38]
MSLRQENKIIVLLGAGASYEAGIPTSPKMTYRLEELLKSNGELSEFRSLYSFIKSAIYFADGIIEIPHDKVNYNIERLVNTLSELERKVEHPLYPFIGNWHNKLTELAGADFSKVHELKAKIINKLKSSWVLPRTYERSEYYSGLFRFAQEYNYPLRVFSLNYDLCVERNTGKFVLERGFGEQSQWNWRNFNEVEADAPNVYLYKLHGSIDWCRDDNNNLIYVDEISTIDPSQLEIIFGTYQKLKYSDPFLFLAYEFRKWTLESKLIIAIGYGFGDEHINGILKQALMSASDSEQRKLLVVSTFSKLVELNEKTERNEVRKIERLIGISEDSGQVKIKKMGASDFIGLDMSIDSLNTYFSISDSVF